MKIISKVLLPVICCIALLTSCHSTKKEVGSVSNLPAWVIDYNVKGTIAGVGISNKTKGGIKLQLAEAESDARANIAAQIQTEVSRVTKDAMRKADIEGVEDVEAVFSQATKEVIKNLPLSGTRRTDIYKDPSDGTLYVRMIIDQAQIKKYLEESEKIFNQDLKKANLSRARLNAAQNAAKDLFDEVDLERKGQSPIDKEQQLESKNESKSSKY